MRFAVIGDLSEAAPVVAAIHDSPDHEVATSWITGALAEVLMQRQLALSLVPSSEDAILHAAVDAVIVAIQNVEESVAVVRRATQEELCVIAVPPEAVSTAWSFELHLLLDECKTGILPLTGRWYTARALRPVVQSASAIRQLRLTLPLLPEAQAQRRLQLHAIDAICSSGLQFSQITGLDVPGADGAILSRTVTLASSESAEHRSPPATIQFERDAPPAAVIRIQHTDGQTTDIAMGIPCTGILSEAGQPGPDPERLVACLKDHNACGREMEACSNTLELLEGLDKSFRRRRTVDVYFDAVSERAVFKTQMTAIGCGVLTWVIFGLVGYLVMAQVLELPPTVLNIARGLWIAPVVFFLLAQLLLPLARERSSKDEHRIHSSSE